MKYPDARGWIGIGTYVLCLIVFGMFAAFPELRKDDFFKTLATIVISTAFVNQIVGWGYGSTKSGGELAARNADIVQAQTTASNTVATEPLPVIVANTDADAVPTKDTTT